MRTRFLWLAAPAALIGIVMACGGGNENLPPPPPPPPPPPSVTPTASTTPVVDAGPPTPAAPPVALTLGAAAADPTPAPTVKLNAPTKGQVIPADKAKDFEVKLDVKNWQTAPMSQHVHLILDNRPYMPIYDLKKKVTIGDLIGNDTLAEGQHVIVAFPSRPTHESVKSKDALAIVDFVIGKKGDSPVDVKKPLMIYSRPKGDYKGDMANHVLVDFQLMNETLAEGKDHVHITVTGPGIDKELSQKAEKFGPPFYLDNLQNGSYTIKLELMDGSMKVIPNGAWNSTTRVIRVDHDAPNDMPMAMGGGDAGAAPVVAKDAGAAPPAAKDAGAKK
jgi:hypothetical protein